MLLKKYKGGIFSKGDFSLQDIINEVKSNNNISKSGAIFTFTGIVRENSLFNNKLVDKIEIESWDEKVFYEMDEICKELIEKFDLIDMRIWHATGTFETTEDLVYIVIASKHRKSGLLALEDGIEMYKSRAPIWKKEIYCDGKEEWISGKEKM